MTFLQLLVLAFVQGMTEFLPVSSSGHLALVPFFTSWPDQGQAMDVAMHLGTLVAVLLYFNKDIIGMIKGLIAWPKHGASHHSRLAMLILVATIPVIFAGFAIKALIGDAARAPEIIAIQLIVFGLLLYWADRRGKHTNSLEDLNTKDAMLIGIAQCCALIPGTSRSGVTMTMARFLGYTRVEAAKFSMLLSIPTISAAGLLATLELASAASPIAISDMLLGAAMSAVFGIIAIFLLMKLVGKISFLPFAVYRVLLGGIIIALIV